MESIIASVALRNPDIGGEGGEGEAGAGRITNFSSGHIAPADPRTCRYCADVPWPGQVVFILSDVCMLLDAHIAFNICHFAKSIKCNGAFS